MKDGLPNGQWQEWFENGKLKYNAYWKEGKGHGYGSTSTKTVFGVTKSLIF